MKLTLLIKKTMEITYVDIMNKYIDKTNSNHENKQ